MVRYTIKLCFAFLALSLFLIKVSIAQDDCKVLSEKISTQYDGECKKGLADGSGTAKGEDTYVGAFKKGVPHGIGTYTWADGNIYVGEFKRGLKDGKGKLTVALPDGQKKVQEGYWLKDKYIGENESPYTLHYRSPGVLSVRFKETTNSANDGSAVFVEILHRGKIQSSASFNLDVSTGSFKSRFPVGNSTKILVDVFPFGFTLNYMGESVQVELFQDTSWSISIDFNK